MPTRHTFRHSLRVVLAATLTVTTTSPTPAADPGLQTFARWDAAHLAGRADPPAPFTVTDAFPKLRFGNVVTLLEVPPLETDGRPAPQRFITLELDGKVATHRNDKDATQRDEILNLKTVAPADGVKRIWIMAYSVVFDHAFPDKPYIYIAFNRRAPKPETNFITRYTLKSLDPAAIDPDSEHIIIQWETNGHDGCDLKFGPDGMLYASTGDAQAPGDPANLGQTVDNLLGSILRIDVRESTTKQPYRVPKDNPFIGVQGVRPEIWAYGLRNPWRMNFDPQTGDLWLGDNGDQDWEMVYLVRKGANFGWSAYEGSHPFRLSNAIGGPMKEVTFPVVEHPHHEARSVIGGLVYRRDRHKALKGHYIYGDYVNGRVWAFRWDGQKVHDHRLIASIARPIVSFSEDRNGQIYITAQDGGVLRLLEAPADPDRKPFPKKLSETGLFASVIDHRPAPGVMPYSINASSWHDGAKAQRFFAMPKQGVIRPDVGRSWLFPDGGAFVKTLSLPVREGDGTRWRRVETQLIHQDNGAWHFHTYRWNERQTDAALVDSSGEDASVEVADASAPGGVRTQRWRFLSSAECGVCHTARTNFALSLTSQQLNRDHDYAALGGRSGNQLDTFDALGLLRKPFKDVKPPLPDPHDENADLAARARTYLHVNCAHCHSEGGVAGRAEFRLSRELALDATRMVNVKPKLPIPGIEDPRLIAPGEPHRSELFRRMNTRTTGQMPLFGSSVVDEQGAALIRQWIESMKEE